MRHQSRSHFDVFSLQNNAAGSELVWPQQQSRISPPFIRNADVDVEAIKRKELPRHFGKRTRTPGIDYRGEPSTVRTRGRTS